MASRVVPGMSLTMARSWPSSALSSELLPTLGRPMMAMRAGSLVHREGGLFGSAHRALRSAPLARAPPRRCLRSNSAGDSGGSAQTITSSRSATPRPCSALIGWVSAQPRRWNSAASSSRLRVVGLVGGDDQRRLGGAQQLAGLLVGRRQARLARRPRGRSRPPRQSPGVPAPGRAPRWHRRGASPARPCRPPRSVGRSTRRCRRAGHASSGPGPRRWPRARRRCG